MSVLLGERACETDRLITSDVLARWRGDVAKFQPQRRMHARSKRVNSPTHANVVKPLYRTAMERWRNCQKYLEPHLVGVEHFLKAFQYD